MTSRDAITHSDMRHKEEQEKEKPFPSGSQGFFLWPVNCHLRKL